MVGPQQLLRSIAGHLNASGVKWALVGGLAVSVRTQPRFTQDIDLAVGVASDEAAERLVGLLAQRGFQIASIVEQASIGRMALASMRPSADVDDTLVDLLFAMSGIETEIVENASILEVLPGVSAPVAEVPYLIALKVLARDDITRPQDLVDLKSLLAVATEADLSSAAACLSLIHDRGYDRGKDLQKDLDIVRQMFRRGT